MNLKTSAIFTFVCAAVALLVGSQSAVAQYGDRSSENYQSAVTYTGSELIFDTNSTIYRDYYRGMTTRINRRSIKAPDKSTRVMSVVFDVFVPGKRLPGEQHKHTAIVKINCLFVSRSSEVLPATGVGEWRKPNQKTSQQLPGVVAGVIAEAICPADF